MRPSRRIPKASAPFAGDGFVSGLLGLKIRLLGSVSRPACAGNKSFLLLLHLSPVGDPF